MASKKPWREFVKKLSQKQRDKMLTQLLEWQIDVLGQDVCYRPADEDCREDIYWDSSGDSLVFPNSP